MFPNVSNSTRPIGKMRDVVYDFTSHTHAPRTAYSARRTSSTSTDTSNVLNIPSMSLPGRTSSKQPSPTSYRVTNIPSSWDASEVRTGLAQLDQSAFPATEEHTVQIELFPSIGGKRKIAIVTIPFKLKDITGTKSWCISEPSVLDLTIDCDFLWTDATQHPRGRCGGRYCSGKTPGEEYV